MTLRIGLAGWPITSAAAYVEPEKDVPYRCLGTVSISREFVQFSRRAVNGEINADLMAERVEFERLPRQTAGLPGRCPQHTRCGGSAAVTKWRRGWDSSGCPADRRAARSMSPTHALRGGSAAITKWRRG
jgi:hypothetical protein